MTAISGDIPNPDLEAQVSSAEQGEVNNREVEIILQELTRGPHELILGTRESVGVRFVIAQSAAMRAAVKDLTKSTVSIESVAEKRDLFAMLVT